LGCYFYESARSSGEKALLDRPQREIETFGNAVKTHVLKVIVEV
jgi:hypothetical protein